MILSDNRQTQIALTEEIEKVIENIVEFAIRSENVKENYEVSIIFVDNNKIKELNNDFRNIDRDTDVLSFPMLEYPEGKVYKDIYAGQMLNDEYYDEGSLILGDIAISLEKAMEQSLEYQHSFEREIAYLIVHSILHLLGYDHIEEQEKNIMRKREEEILANFNITR